MGETPDRGNLIWKEVTCGASKVMRKPVVGLKHTHGIEEVEVE